MHDLAPVMTCKVVNKTSQVYLLITLSKGTLIAKDNIFVCLHKAFCSIFQYIFILF